MGLVRFIIFALFFYLIYFLVKYIFVRPFKEGFAGNDSRKAKNGFKNPFASKKEGDVSITYDPRKSPPQNKEVGEYVDYEEVKEQ